MATLYQRTRENYPGNGYECFVVEEDEDKVWRFTGSAYGGSIVREIEPGGERPENHEEEVYPTMKEIKDLLEGYVTGPTRRMLEKDNPEIAEKVWEDFKA